MFKSKTIWFNVITIALAVIQQVQPMIPDNTEFYKYLAFTVAIGNTLLRFFTDKPLNAK